MRALRLPVAPEGVVASPQNCPDLSISFGEFEAFYMRLPRRFAPRNDITEGFSTR